MNEFACTELGQQHYCVPKWTVIYKISLSKKDHCSLPGDNEILLGLRLGVCNNQSQPLGFDYNHTPSLVMFGEEERAEYISITSLSRKEGTLRRHLCPSLWLSYHRNNRTHGIGISLGISWNLMQARGELVSQKKNSHNFDNLSDLTEETGTKTTMKTRTTAWSGLLRMNTLALWM